VSITYIGPNHSDQYDKERNDTTKNAQVLRYNKKIIVLFENKQNEKNHLASDLLLLLAKLVQFALTDTR